MASDTKLDLQSALDGLGQGILIFSSDGRLVVENLAARTLLGTDISLLRAQGWAAASTLFNSRQTDPDRMIEAIRDQALRAPRPVRSFFFRSGEHVPCWVSAIHGDGGEVYTMITLDVPDWSVVTNLLDAFRSEIGEAIETTRGHLDLIDQVIATYRHSDVETLSRRVNGFTRLIDIHMQRASRFIQMLERLENIRTGKVREVVRRRRRKIALPGFIEDFIEELDEIMLVDPETDAQDHRSRLTVNMPGELAVAGSTLYLTRILHDLLRNAIMYSIKASPIIIDIHRRNQNVQFDVIDEGCGIRERERERVFEAFQRARQPQIIAEFGYGLSLYLCKHEVEAMNGRLWYESEEGVGTTFSFMLPAWREDESAVVTASSSDTTT
jgi:signal transduction histidine kinase